MQSRSEIATGSLDVQGVKSAGVSTEGTFTVRKASGTAIKELHSLREEL